MAKKKQASAAAKSDGASFSLDWFRTFHPFHYSFWPLGVLYIWTGNFKFAATVVAAMWVVGVTTWVVLWRRRWVATLAGAGVPRPNLFKLAGQVTRAKRRMGRAVKRFELTAINQPKLQSSAASGRKIPRLERLRITVDLNVEADIDMAVIGRTVNDLRDCSAAVAQVAGAEAFIVRQRTPGRAHVIWQFTDPLHTVLRFRDMPLPVKPTKTQPRWVGGVDEHGAPMEVPIDKPVMVGGEQGSGKSVFAWDLLGSLNQQGLWVKVYVVDPKGGMELGRLREIADGDWHGRLQVAAFSAGDDTKAGTAVIQQAYNQIDMRAKKLAEKRVRNFAPGGSKDDPIILLLIDEALDYSKLWKDSDSVLLRYLRKARAVGGTAIAIFQYGHASDIGVGQKVFGARFCFRAAKETGDTILGTGAYERGARVNEIPRSQPGIGYYVDDEGQMLRFRAAHVTDEVADVLAVGGVPLDMGAGTTTTEVEKEVACYRLFNADRTSLYVGQSVDPWGNMDAAGDLPYGPGGRFSQHADDKPWWHEADWSLARVTWHPAKEIDQVEKAEIHRLGPIYNDKLNRKNTLRVDWRKQSDGKVVPFRRPTPAPAQVDDGVLDGEVLDEHETFEPVAAHWGSE